MTQSIAFELNGCAVTTEAEAGESLLFLIRDRLKLYGAKRGCDYGGCGACTVLVNGNAVYSCMYPGLRADGKALLTIEGLSQGGELHPLQTAFHEHWAVQCGFCSAGMVMAAKALLDRNPEADEREIRETLVGNLCVCTGYVKIVEAIRAAGQVLAAARAGRREQGAGLMAKTVDDVSGRHAADIRSAELEHGAAGPSGPRSDVGGPRE